MRYPGPMPVARLSHVLKVRWLPLLLAACTSTLVGCASTPTDPLDPAEIDDVAKAQGDAAGTDRSGNYFLKLTGAAECDCPTVYQMDLCKADVNGLATGGGGIGLQQTDGNLLLTEDRGLLTLTGAIEADGSFDIAAIQAFGSVLGNVALYVRLTGRFDGPTGFTGEVQSRALGTFDGDDIDCRTDAEVAGVRVLSP